MNPGLIRQLPTSNSQDELCFLEEMRPATSASHLATGLWLFGALDIVALEAALGRLVNRYETLRTYFACTAEGRVRAITDHSRVTLPVVPVTGADAAARRSHARVRAAEIAHRPFDFAAVPPWRAALLRIADDEHLLIWAAHQLILDAASSETVLHEWAGAYNALVDGSSEAPADPPPAGRGPRPAKDVVGYWRRRLADAPPLAMPTDRPRPRELSFRGSSARAPIDRELCATVRGFAEGLGVAPYAVYLAPYLELLRRYANQDDLVVGCLTGGRATRTALGSEANLVAIRSDAGGALTVNEAVTRAAGAVEEAFAHADLSFLQVVEAVAPERDPSRMPLVQTVFQQPSRRSAPSLSGLRVKVECPIAGACRFDLIWQVCEDSETAEGAYLNVDYSVDLFDADTIGRLQAHYLNLLTGFVTDSGRAVGRVRMLSPTEYHEMLHRWDGPRRPLPAESVDRLFARQVKLRPEAIAVVAGPHQLRYRELDEEANRLAWLLRERGTRPGDRVALCLPRGHDYIVAVLAVLKAGAAFVPLDASYPRERLAALVRDADPRLIVTVGGLPLAEPDGGVQRVLLDEIDAAGHRADRPPATPGTDDAAYVLYTSGSTGTPKGVVVEHHSVVAFAEATSRLFELTCDDRVLGYASHSFDVSVGEMFNALLNGAQLHVALDEDRRDMDRLQRLLETSEITVSDMPPSVMALLDPSRLPHYRIAFVGGEAFSGDLVNRWNTVARFFNGYGPTECTVTMITHECSGRWEGSPPIGLPIANHVAHVVDCDLEPVPYGVPGELVIGGEGLARGYLNDPGLTAEKFIPDPFGTAPGGRLYRTGDLVTRRPDGALVFLGRIDRQLKIRGVRIEPNEVEAVLAAEPGVRQAHVGTWTDRVGQRHLIAHVGVGVGAAVDRPTPEGLLAAAEARLPIVMVPSFVVVMDELPLTASGKVDERALPPPAATGSTPADLPRTDTERLIATQIVGPALGLAKVDVNANFFRIGGNSLQAAQLVSAVRQTFAAEVDMADFLRNPTVAALASVIDQQRGAR